jgi:ATP-binding cassette subfamily B protein
MTQFAMRAYPMGFAAMIVLQVLQGGFPVATAWVTKQIFDLLGAALKGDGGISFSQGFLPLLIIQAVLSLANQLMGSADQFLSSEFNRRLTLMTQGMVYEHISSLDGLVYFEDPKFHDTLRLASQGAMRGPSQMLNFFSSFLSGLVTLFSFLGVLLYLSPALALIVAIASLPQLYFQLKIARQHFGLAYMNSPKERKAYYLGNILSDVYYAKEVRLFSLGKYFLKQFLQITREIQATEREQEIHEMRWRVGLGVLANVVSSGAFVAVVSQAFSGRITLGDVTLYITALGSVQGALFGMIYAFGNLNENILFFSHFTNLLALPTALPALQPIQGTTSLDGSIELRNVSFRYSDQHPWVLQNVNLTFPKGKCLGLVGLNGAGKTTLVKLLTRLYDPTEGEILWDGVDIRHFETRELRQRMGAIFQDFVHYDLTAEENIGLGHVDEIGNTERIHQAAVDAGVDEVLEKLPQGYKTVLSRWLAEDMVGIDLSGGQWQKIAIARMFMRDTDFLILDEPTAALDAEAEYEIYNHFVHLVKGRTSLLISHRFSTMRIADVIAVLEGGKIVEYGTHDELLRTGNTYARLYNMQLEQHVRSP